jgi:hypothetical protein
MPIHTQFYGFLDAFGVIWGTAELAGDGSLAVASQQAYDSVINAEGGTFERF